MNKLPNKLLVLFVLLSTPTLLLATDTFYASYIKGDEESLDKEVLDALGKQLETILGFQLKYRGASFARNLLLMQQGENDLMAFLTKQPERETYLHYIEPEIFNLNVTFIVRKGEHTRIQNYDDLYGLRIGTFRDAKYFPRFNSDKLLNKSYTISFRQGINKLLLNRLDAIIVSEHVALFHIWQSGLYDKLELSLYANRNSNPMHIVLSKNAGIMQHIDEIEPIIHNMIQSGQIRTIIEQFYTQRNLPIPKLWQ